MIVGAIYLIIAMAVGFGVGFAVAQIGRSQPAMQTDVQVVLDQKIQELAEHKQEVANHFLETSNLIRNMTDSYRVVLEHLNHGAEKLVGEHASGNLLELAGHTSLLARQHASQPQQLSEETASYLANETAAKSSVVLENTESADSTTDLSKAASQVEVTDLTDALAANQTTTEEQASHREIQSADDVAQAGTSAAKDPVVADETRAPQVTEARDVVDSGQHQADARPDEGVVEQVKDEPMQSASAAIDDDVIKPLDAETVNAERAEELAGSTSPLQGEVEVVAKTEMEVNKVDDVIQVEETPSIAKGDNLATAKVIVDHQNDQTEVSPSAKNEADESTKIWRREDEAESSSHVNASITNNQPSATSSPLV